MEPNHNNQPQNVTPPSFQTNQSQLLSVQPKKSIKLPLFLMLWPAVSIVGVLILYIIIANLFTNEAATADNLFGPTSPAKRIANVLMYLVGTLSLLLGPISFIVGLVMLIKRKSTR